MKNNLAMIEKIQLDDKVGIIAGGGFLPRQLISELQKKNIRPYVVALNDVTDKETTEGVETLWARMGSAGRILSFFHDNGVKQVALAGWVKRPSFASLIPDSVGLKLLNKFRKLNEAGDNSVFDLVVQFLEEQGLQIIGVDDIATELLATKGVMGKVSPVRKFLNDIEYGAKIALEIGKLDIGQAVIVQNGVVLGVEGFDGTDALIDRCAKLQIDGKGAILVKMKKQKQDRRIDLPSMGVKTIEKLHELGFKGVAVQAGNSLIINKEETLKKADELGIFVVGV